MIGKLTPLFILPVFISSCDGAFSGIYDDPPSDSSFKEGFTKNADNRFTLHVDGTDYSQWTYIDFGSGEMSRVKIPSYLPENEKWDGKSGWSYQLVEGGRYTLLSETRTSAQPEPNRWSIAIHHFDVRTNGGEVFETKYKSLDQLPLSSEFDSERFHKDEWTDNVVMTDLKEMMGYKIGYQNISVNRLLSGWVKMDFSNPPPTYETTGHVYIIRFPNGERAAIKLNNYMSGRGSKGYLDIEGIYPY